MYRIELVFGDGTRQSVDTYDDFDDAAGAAFEMAEGYGRRPRGDGHGPPHKVEIWQGTSMQISIQIISGGLLTRKADPKSRSM